MRCDAQYCSCASPVYGMATWKDTIGDSGTTCPTPVFNALSDSGPLTLDVFVNGAPVIWSSSSTVKNDHTYSVTLSGLPSPFIIFVNFPVGFSPSVRGRSLTLDVVSNMNVTVAAANPVTTPSASAVTVAAANPVTTPSASAAGGTSIIIISVAAVIGVAVLVVLVLLLLVRQRRRTADQQAATSRHVVEPNNQKPIQLHNDSQQRQYYSERTSTSSEACDESAEPIGYDGSKSTPSKKTDESGYLDCDVDEDPSFAASAGLVRTSSISLVIGNGPTTTTCDVCSVGDNDDTVASRKNTYDDE